MRLSLPALNFSRKSGRRLAVLGSAVGMATSALMAPTTAQAATATYRLSYNKLPDGRSQLVHWNPCQVITYKINLAAVPAKSRAAFLTETHAGIAAVAARTGMVFRYRGATTEVPTTSNATRQSAEIIIAYTTPARTNLKLSGNTLGMGGYRSQWWGTWDGTKYVYNGAITRGYLVIDTPDVLKRLSPGYGPGLRRGNVLLHELGHVFGLDHVTDPRQQMYGSLSRVSPNGYAWGDTAGLKKLGRSAGCISAPSSVVKDLN